MTVTGKTCNSKWNPKFYRNSNHSRRVPKPASPLSSGSIASLGNNQQSEQAFQLKDVLVKCSSIHLTKKVRNRSKGLHGTSEEWQFNLFITFGLFSSEGRSRYIKSTREISCMLQSQSKSLKVFRNKSVVLLFRY